MYGGSYHYTSTQTHTRARARVHARTQNTRTRARITLINFNRAAFFYFTLSVDTAKIDARVASSCWSAEDLRARFVRRERGPNVLSVITVAPAVTPAAVIDRGERDARSRRLYC